MITNSIYTTSEYKTLKLSDCCIFISDGDHQPPPKASYGIPFITISNIGINNKIDFSDTMYVTEEYYKNLDEKKIAKEGDILLSVVGSYGIPVLIEDNRQFVFQRHIAILRPNNDIILSEFLYFIIQSNNFYKELTNAALGAAQKTVSLSALRNIYVKVPSLTIQRKFVEGLSLCEKLITTQRNILLSLENRKKGILQKILRQDIRLKDRYTDDWQTYPLYKVLEEYHEKCPKNGKYEHVSLTKEGVVPKSERYDRDFLVTTDNKNYRVTHYDDICYNPANLKFGVICRNAYKDAIFSPIYITFRVKEIALPKFIELLVTQNDFINYALKYQQGTVYERMAVSPEDLLSIEIKIPSKTEQKDIVEFVDILNDEISKQNDIITAQINIKKWLLQQFC